MKLSDIFREKGPGVIVQSEYHKIPFRLLRMFEKDGVVHFEVEYLKFNKRDTVINGMPDYEVVENEVLDPA